MKKLFIFTNVFIGSLLWFSCSYTETNKIVPTFTITNDSLARDINSIIFAPAVNVVAKEITTDGKAVKKLFITLLNPTRVPEDENERRNIANYVAILVKKALKDTTLFEEYQVSFTRNSGDAIKKTTSITEVFDKTALKSYIQYVSLGNEFDTVTQKATGSTTFSQSDENIISVFSYYNNIPNAPIKINVYKESDSSKTLILSEKQGHILEGNKYLLNKFKTASFYGTPRLGTGSYKIEYTVSDTVVGSKHFILK